MSDARNVYRYRACRASHRCDDGCVVSDHRFGRVSGAELKFVRVNLVDAKARG